MTNHDSPQTVDEAFLKTMITSTRTDHEKVGDFHEKFGLDNTTHRSVGPRKMNLELLTFRIRFMLEELREYVESSCEITVKQEEAFDALMTSVYIPSPDVDHAKAFDALLDLDYVVHGTAHFSGYPWEAGMCEVQRANM